MKRQALGAAILLLATAPLPASQQPPDRADTVAVVGCLKEVQPGTWHLVEASDPVASHANAPTEKELAELPRQGKNTYTLIGVTVFNLQAHRDHSLAVKGLLIKASPVSRINVTSVTMAAAKCPAG